MHSLPSTALLLHTALLGELGFVGGETFSFLRTRQFLCNTDNPAYVLTSYPKHMLCFYRKTLLRGCLFQQQKHVLTLPVKMC